MKKRTYWNEEFKGECKSGYYMRCNLFEKIKHFEEMGYKVVGITVDDSWNIEFICNVGCKKEVTKGAYTFKCGDMSKKGKVQLCKECKEDLK